MKLIPPLCALLLTLTACEQHKAANPSPASQAPKEEKISAPAYRNSALPIEERVNDLIGRMTLSEKVGQLNHDAPAIERLGIPSYSWWNESLHGVARAGKATVFPQAIGLASTFNPALIGEIATAISDEARAKHHYFVRNGVRAKYTGLTFWSPNVNLFRDPRWGRGQETYGEAPYLISALAVEFIKGLQGDHPKYLKAAAAAKHFGVHSGPEKTRHSDDYHATPKELVETYFPAFKAAVTKANVETVMCAYNLVNGEPSCGNDMLLKQHLRGDWGFKGHVVSDCGALADFYGPGDHALVSAPAVAAAWALNAGTDLNCSTQRLSTFANLVFAQQKGLVSLEAIDAAVKRLFTTRFKLGMFDPDDLVPYSKLPIDVVGSANHLALAEKAAEQSLVLLKNDGTLPLKDGTRVALIGPNAANPQVLVGNYNGTPINPILPINGIAARAGADKINYALGSSLIADRFSNFTIISAENLFHRDQNGELQPGLIADYYRADPVRAYTHSGHKPEASRVGEPVRSEIVSEINAYWDHIPTDDSVFSDFSVAWHGILKPVSSGRYLFRSDGSIKIDGKPVSGALSLNAEQEYTLEVDRSYLSDSYRQMVEAELKLQWVNTTPGNLTAQAVAAAQTAEVIIFAGGIDPTLEGEEMSVALEGFDSGDRTSLELPKEQRELLQVLHALGKPIVLVNFSGSAIALNWEAKNVNAVIQAFYPGEAAGKALASVLWGDVNPSGRLPVTFYRSAKDLPDFKDYSLDNRTYRYFTGDVLYPFGHGLSYTNFSYSDIQAPKVSKSGATITLTATITNTGEHDGAEIAQLYISLPDAPKPTPIRSLKDVQRIELQKGESKTISFTLNAEDLEFVDTDGSSKPYTGKLIVTVGSGQEGHIKSEQLVKTEIALQ